MKVLAPLFAFFALASAQGLTIGTPNQGERVPLERPFTVQVIRETHGYHAIEVAITIGIVPCPESSGCPNPSVVGQVLYKGPYEPQVQASGYYQNFTITIPFDEDLIGPSQLTVNRFFLIGVQNGAALESYGVQIETFSL